MRDACDPLGPRGEPAVTARAPAGTPRWEAVRCALRALALPQLWTLFGCAVAVAADWAVSLVREAFSRRRDVLRAERRARAASRLVAALGALKGAFAKAGQFAAIRYDVLPPPVTAAFATLRDRVPPLALSRVRPTLEAELGAPLEAVFAEFEPEAIAAASVAQVHRARLPGGEPVAVKVQYPWLRTSLPADLVLARALLALWSWRTGSRLDRRRVFAEFAAGLREELDFEREARVAREIAANLAQDPQICVPEIFASHSTRRVLTMSYHPTVSVTDREGLARLGVDPLGVLEIIGRAYAKQVFADGLFHADPHPGNLFVLDEPTANQTPRVLFVDFGLSRRLDPLLRRELRRGIHAVLQRDVDAFVAAMNRMGMIAPGAEPQVRGAVADMLERIGERGPLEAVGSQVLALKDRAKALLQETAGVQLPNDLLLYAKTMSYVFALGAELAPDADLMKTALPHLLQFLADNDSATPSSSSFSPAQ